jgi:hypothetical protein
VRRDSPSGVSQDGENGLGRLPSPLHVRTEDYQAVDRINCYLKLTFADEKPEPSQAFEQAVLMAAEESGGYE